MKIISAVQGSPEWSEIRAKHFTASEVSAAMGLSKYTTRSELLHQKATGIVPDVDIAKQALFDRGHAAEAATRGVAEDTIGEELYQVTCTRDVEGLPLLASLDGLNMAGDTAWECKLFNNGLASAIERKEIEPHYWAQLEQQLLVSGASRVLFTTATTDGNNLVSMWYKSVPERRAQIIAAWKQFAEDLANYQPTEATPQPVASTIESLPALLVQVDGRVLTTNLDQFKKTAMDFIKSIKTELSTDQDFADADKMAKFLKDGEDKLEMVKEQTLAQTASIDDLFRTIDSLKEEMRTKRLTLGKLVESRKVSIRTEIQEAGAKAVREHLDALNKRIGKPYMPDKKWADFAAVMRGKKTITSLRGAVNDEVARVKIESNAVADIIQVNLNSLRELAADHAFLFADTQHIVLKANDDLVALIKTRIAEHKEAERQKAEQARIKKEQEDARAAAISMQAGVDAPAVAAVIAHSGASPQATTTVRHVGEVIAQATTARPTDDQIINVLATHYHVHKSVVIGWILAMALVIA